MRPVKRVKYCGSLGLLDDPAKGNASIFSANSSKKGNLAIGRVQHLCHHRSQKLKSQKIKMFLRPENIPCMKMEY